MECGFFKMFLCLKVTVCYISLLVFFVLYYWFRSRFLLWGKRAYKRKQMQSFKCKPSLRSSVPIYFSLMLWGKLRSCSDAVFRWVCFYAAVSNLTCIWEYCLGTLYVCWLGISLSSEMPEDEMFSEGFTCFRSPSWALRWDPHSLGDSQFTYENFGLLFWVWGWFFFQFLSSRTMGVTFFLVFSMKNNDEELSFQSTSV